MNTLQHNKIYTSRINLYLSFFSELISEGPLDIYIL